MLVQTQLLGRFLSDGHKKLKIWTNGEDSKQSLLEMHQVLLIFLKHGRRVYCSRSFPVLLFRPRETNICVKYSNDPNNATLSSYYLNQAASSFLCKQVFWRDFAIGHVCSPERQKVRNHPPKGLTMLQSLLLHSPLGILGTNADVPGMSFKPPGLGLELQLTTWESSNIAILPTADPPNQRPYSSHQDHVAELEAELLAVGPPGSSTCCRKISIFKSLYWKLASSFLLRANRGINFLLSF